jgi:TRAP-type mannitol/chloroaromatic compound transport system substrate-binding protein
MLFAMIGGRHFCHVRWLTDNPRALLAQSRRRGLRSEAMLAWHKQEGGNRPKYLFKLHLTTNVHRATAKVPWPRARGE